MRKLVNPVPAGGAPLFGDSVFGPVIQDIYTALEAFLYNSFGSTSQGIIISGCVVTANGGNWDCSSGVVYLNGKIMTFAGFTNQPASKYIVAATLTNTAKTFFDGVSRNILTVENATFQGSIPGSGQYIPINSSPLRLVNAAFPSVQNGTGIGQLTNIVKIGWSGSRLKATVDSTDLGTLIYNGNGGVAIQDIAGNGLSESSGQIQVNTDDVTIEKNSDTLRFKPLVWNTVTLANSWAGTLQYAIDGYGKVHLKGTLIPGASTSADITAAGALPSPSISKWFAIGLQASPYVQTALVDTTGKLSISNGYSTFASNPSFDIISYFP